MAVMLSVLGSGSRGNATFIKTDSARILIDAGLSLKDLAKRLESIGEDPDGIERDQGLGLAAEDDHEEGSHAGQHEDPVGEDEPIAAVGQLARQEETSARRGDLGARFIRAQQRARGCC